MKTAMLSVMRYGSSQELARAYRFAPGPEYMMYPIKAAAVGPAVNSKDTNYHYEEETH